MILKKKEHLRNSEVPGHSKKQCYLGKTGHLEISGVPRKVPDICKIHDIRKRGTSEKFGGYPGIRESMLSGNYDIEFSGVLRRYLKFEKNIIFKKRVYLRNSGVPGNSKKPFCPGKMGDLTISAAHSSSPATVVAL